MNILLCHQRWDHPKPVIKLLCLLYDQIWKVINITSFVWSHLNSYQSCHPHTFESSCTKVLQDLCKATRTSAQILHRWIEDWTRPAWLFRMVDGSHNHHNIEYFFINAFIWLLSTWDGRSSPSGSLEKRSGLPSIQTFSKSSTFPTSSM